MKRSLFILLTAIALLGSGCAKEKMKAASSDGGDDTPPVVEVPQDGTPYTPPGSGPGQGPGQNWEYGATAALNIRSLSVMSDYTGRPMNNPQDIKLNVNLVKYGSNSYGGHVTITYTENGEEYEGYFTSGGSPKENKYNIWFTKDGKTAYHGFFEDFLGGLVLVIDDFTDLGDGGGPQSKAGGRVYFKNFDLTYAPHPPTRCWFVRRGPYDCRAWKDGKGVDSTRAINPDNGYVLLGSFEDLDLETAFNGELDL